MATTDTMEMRYDRLGKRERMPSPPRLDAPGPLIEEARQTRHIPYYRAARASHSPSPAAQIGHYQANDTAVETQSALDARSHAQVGEISHASWAYSLRRSAQPVLDNLYLGPTSAAKDVSFLRTEGITMIIGLKHLLAKQVKADDNAAQQDGSSRPPFDQCLEVPPPPGVTLAAEQLGISCVQLGTTSQQQLPKVFSLTKAYLDGHLQHNALFPPLKDSSSAQPHLRLQAAAAAAAAHREAQNSSSEEGAMTSRKVLLCCETGNERSAACCAAYLMATLHAVDWRRAIQLVQTQRFCANYDDAAKRTLQAYWDVLLAGRMVEESLIGVDAGSGGGRGNIGQQGGGLMALQQHQQSSNNSGKRRRDVAIDEDGDMDMDGAGKGEGAYDDHDEERFRDRDYAPFVDL